MKLSAGGCCGCGCWLILFWFDWIHAVDADAAADGFKSNTDKPEATLLLLLILILFFFVSSSEVPTIR